MTIDDRSAKNIATLNENVQGVARRFLEMCSSGMLPYTVKIICGSRTWDEQNKIFNQPWDGKDNDGDGKIDEADEKVSNAKGGQSWHNYGIAFDIGCFYEGKYIDDLIGKTHTHKQVDDVYLAAGEIGESLGLEWGGRWKFVDSPHFQYNPKNYTLAKAKEIYARDGRLS